MRFSRSVLGSSGQWLAALCVIAGIGIEVLYMAHAGFIFITLGSLIFAIATKIKYHKSE